jgi:hypothetical protein
MDIVGRVGRDKDEDGRSIAPAMAPKPIPEVGRVGDDGRDSWAAGVCEGDVVAGRIGGTGEMGGTEMGEMGATTGPGRVFTILGGRTEAAMRAKAAVAASSGWE